MTRTKTDYLVVLEEWRQCFLTKAHIIYGTVPQYLEDVIHDYNMRIVYDPKFDEIQVQLFFPDEDGWTTVLNDSVKDKHIPLFSGVTFQERLESRAV